MRKAQQEIATPDNVHNTPRKVRSQGITRKTTRWLTYTAIFAALALAMKFIGQALTFTPSFKVTLIYTVWLISGAVLGPVGGGAVCFVSDVLGALIMPTSDINPFLIFGNTLYGVIAALVFRFTPSKHYAVKFVASGLACTLVCTCLVNSAAIWYWYKYYTTLTFWQYFVSARPLQLVVAGINIVITLCMIPILDKYKMFPEPKKKREAKLPVQAEGKLSLDA